MGLWFASAFVGWVFASAGAAKVLDLGAFSAEVHRTAPGLPAVPIAWAVALTELVCGVCLLVGIRTEVAALGALSLLAIFALASARQEGDEQGSCGCGGLADVGPRRAHVALNVGLALAAIAVLALAPTADPGWTPLRSVSAYAALVGILLIHAVVGLHAVREARLAIDRTRFGG